MDDDIIQIEEQHYIRATSSRADDRTRVLKQGDTFGVFDRHGDVLPIGLGEQGLFHRGTRHLSRLELRIDRTRPLLLSSTVNEANDVLAVDLTNPDILAPDPQDGVRMPRGCLHLFRSKLIWQGICHERIHVANYGAEPVRFSLQLRFDADFVDIFEVRGTRRPARGRRLESRAEGSRITLAYEGLDGEVRKTSLAFSPAPTELSPTHARFDLQLPPQGHANVFLAVGCQTTATEKLSVGFSEAQAALQRSYLQAARRRTTVRTGNEHFDAWLARSASDLDMMTTETAHGLYPYAGVPWFSTVFGRDGIITALQMLWVDPQIARGVLAHLAATQATDVIPEQDAEPGKILHETRTGEMAALGEVPFGRYYGSVDSTPLFVMLAGAYFRRTHDRAFIQGLWPAIERALAWTETHGDPDGDGFVEYARRNPNGLIQQGWKDSTDSVFHADGRAAEGPIALCEVQAYVYAARLGAAEIATALGHDRHAAELRAAAERLRGRFEESFWCEDLGTYALALDGAKRPCRVRSSNAGHCLFAGIASPERARRVATTLLHPTSFSGWGVRTIATSEARYNPMSYHNGSIWPHDNALCAAGLARYGLNNEASTVLQALFDASVFLDLHRLPELYCGFERRPGEGPTLYPVACLPQAWASGALFMLLEATLGLSIDAAAGEVHFVSPQLPAALKQLHLHELRVGDAVLDLMLERHPHDVGVTVVRREGQVRVQILK